MKRLKILPTIGPSSEKENNIKTILGFTNIVRTNGSHNTIDWHENISRKIKSINSEALHLLDIPGVKPRTNNFQTENISKNEIILFHFGKVKKSEYKKIKLTKPIPPIDSKNKFFFLADGQFKFKILNFGTNFIIGKSYSSFELHPQKGLNIPDAIYNNELQLKHYKSFLNKCHNIKYDVIGLSYVQSSDIIKKIRKKFSDKILVSKIENKEGLNNVNEIISESDVIMIDRGDLAAEVGNHNLFNAVLQITYATKKQGKPLIMATENLISMFKKNEPTKSEIMSLGISSLIDGDFIMLSEETAVSYNWHNTLKWLDNYLNKLRLVSLNDQLNILGNKKYLNDPLNDSSNSKLNPSIWESFKFNSNYNFVFISRTGASIKEFKKKYKSNQSIVVTDRISTLNLCKFWKDVSPIYLKSIETFNNPVNMIKILKKYKNLIFNSNRNKAVCLFILNPRKDSFANCIYFIDKKDFN
ncbi:pyruvate kinase [SAR116 cluster bacterium]|nr:pyruvate kinase [SAR116 cluster bacterium]